MQNWMTYVKASYEIILLGESKSNINLEHEVEAYIVHTVARYMEKPNIPTDTIAVKMLKSLEKNNAHKKENLQEIAEECILIDGLELNMNRWPTKNYYRDMGKLALEQRAWIERPPELFYEKIAYYFDDISSILHAIKIK